MRKKTQESKEMSGTFEPSKEPLEGVEYDKYDRLPVCPKGWPPDAKKIWENTCLRVKEANYLSKTFMHNLRRYCFAVYQAQLAESHLLTDGFIIIETGTHGQQYGRPSHWIAVLDAANRVILSVGAKFGFTPLDASKLPKSKKIEGIEENLLS